MWNKADLYEALSAGATEPLLSREITEFLSRPRSQWHSRQLELVRRRALEYLDAPIPQIPYQVFKLYWTCGDRSTHHPLYFERRGRLLVFSILCWLEPEDVRWKEALEDIIWAICEEPFWCIPAHFMGPADTPLPFEQYATQLDLFSCETAFALAETLVLCRDRLSSDVVRQAELQIERRVFTPFLDGDRLFRFEDMHNNWCAVCGGSIGAAALHLMRDPVRLTNLLHRCLSCIDVYLDSFGEDGVSVEGVGYWTYGFGFLVCFADLLEKRSNGALNLFSLPKIQAIAQCQQFYYLTGNHTVSFADGSTQGGFRMGLSCWLQKRYPHAALPDKQFADDVLLDNCYRYCLSLRDFLWYDEDTRFGLPAERSVWLKDAQWLISCGSRLAVAAKAGHNGESHNHNDCGSFILCKDGQPLICDLGAGLYDAAYFGPNRYDLFINASRSHNVALPAGCEQVFGAQHAARDVDLFQSDEVDVLSMELSGCYDCPSLTGYSRSIAHDRSAGTLTLSDTLTFSQEQPFTEVFLSEDPICLEDGRAVFSRSGVSLELAYDPAQFTPSLLEEVYRAHDTGAECTAYLLHLTSAPAREHTCVFTLR